MSIFKNIIIPSLLLLLTVTVCRAQSPLSKLPFDIIAGTTKIADVESNGTCIAKARNLDSSEYCSRYSMSDNKFYVYVGPTMIVSKISFLTVGHHTLPDTWKALGLKLAVAYRYTKALNNDGTPKIPAIDDAGNTTEQYVEILKANGIQDIIRKPTYNSDYEKVEVISFTIGNQRYDAEFIKWVKPKWCTNCPTYADYDNGLVSIEVIEAY